jgi:hypothetical protein
MKTALTSLLASYALASGIKIDITKVPKPKLNMEHKLQATHLTAANSAGDVMQLQEEDPDTYFVKKLFTYPDEHHYMGSLYFGSQRAPANVTFDTGSSFTVVTSDMC